MPRYLKKTQNARASPGSESLNTSNILVRYAYNGDSDLNVHSG